MLFIEASGYELIAIGCREIESEPTPFRTALPRIHKPPLHEMARMARSGERIHQLVTHLVAADADGRAEGHDQIGRPCTELVLQGINRRPRYTGSRAAPARMHRCNRPRSGISQQHRDTISGLHHDSSRTII
jgi:hypothetical protein